MAIETGHLNVFPPQFISNGDLMNSQNNITVNLQRDSPGYVFRQALPGNLLPIYESQAKPSMINGNNMRKRCHDSIDNQLCEVSNSGQIPSLAGDGLLQQMQQHQLEIDSIISQHTKKIRIELEERQRNHTRLLLATIGDAVTKKLKDKDEQIDKMAKLNLVLQERVKSLFVENHLWRDMAQTNEATAMSLRSNLEQVLAQATEERPSGAAAAAAAAVEEDVESCCDSSGDGIEKNRRFSDWTCRRCGERESTVLLMPCRHLCLCYVCGSGRHGLQACPVCNCAMSGTLHVNMSSCS